MARFLAWLLSLQDGWAKPFGEFNHRWLSALFRPIRPIKDVLNGTWLGHPVHPAITDVPIGALLVAIVLDLTDQRGAAWWAILVGLIGVLASAVTGLADYADTDGRARVRATTHGTVMIVGSGLTVGSLILRGGGGVGDVLPTGLLIVGFLVLSAGAYIGGDVVFALGNMVDRHAYRGAGTKWVKLETGAVGDLGDLPEATPTKVRAGINDLVAVRIGTTIHLLHATCAHAGGPLDQGTVTADGCIECPWHASRFRLADGRLRQGPSVYDQPAYELRVNDNGDYEVRRAAS